MAKKDEAQAALYDAVVQAAEDSKRLGGALRAPLLTAAAIAYRAAAGGAQVGGVFVEGK